MLRADLADRLLDDHEDGGYVYPAYEDYCFGSIPGTLDARLGADVPDERTLPDDALEDALAGGSVENVVCVLLDGYGFEQWRRDYRDVPLLDLLSERATVTPLTAIYPSETAAAITTMHTGTLAVEHGLVGWDTYYDELGGLVQPLPHRTPMRGPADEVYPDMDPGILFAGESRYDRLTGAGVTPTLVQPRKNVGGPYAERTAAGAELDPYETIPEMAVTMRQTLESGDGPQYCYGYVPEVDGVAHLHGTDSEFYRAELEAATEVVRRELVERLDPGVAEETLFVLTADHGHVDTGENVDLREGFDVVWENLATTEEGDPIPPAGSPRNVHLFLQDGGVPAVRETLESQLDCVTFTREEAIDGDLFGPFDPGPTFRRRCGDLVVVHRDRGICWDDGGLSHVGMHGGLTRDEMLVPFAAARASDLQ